MIEAYLAYSLIPLFFIILAVVIYLALIRPSISKSAVAQEMKPVQQSSTPPAQPAQPDAADLADKT
jgi:hypothetical protein